MSEQLNEAREKATAARLSAQEALSQAGRKGEGSRNASCASYYVAASLEYASAAAEFKADHLMAGYAHVVVADSWYHAGEICDATGHFP